MLLGERVHARAGREVVGVLGAAVQHHDERHRLPGVALGDVELVRAGAGRTAVRTREEPLIVPNVGGPGGLGERASGRVLHAAGAQVRARLEQVRPKAGAQAGALPGGGRALPGPPDEVGGHVYGGVEPVCHGGARRRTAVAEGALDEGRRLVEAAFLRQACGLGHARLYVLVDHLPLRSGHEDLILPASADFTAGLARRAPSTTIESMVSRASSGPTSSSMLASPRTFISSVSPASLTASRSRRV